MSNPNTKKEIKQHIADFEKRYFEALKKTMLKMSKDKKLMKELDDEIKQGFV